MKNIKLMFFILLIGSFVSGTATVLFIAKKYDISQKYEQISMKVAAYLDWKSEPIVIKVVANDFLLRLDQLPHYQGKSAGILQNSSKELIFYKQSDFNKILHESEIDLSGRNVEAGQFNGGLKSIFKFKDNLIGLFTFSDINSTCYYASLINLTKQVEFMRGPCLSSEGLDFNGIGGGHAELNGNLLIAIGTPTRDDPKISNFAQDLKSPYGKILFFSAEDILKPYNSNVKLNIFSYGHRNPQGIVNVNGHIYSVEHGPKGGDEINYIKIGNNYRWPTNSFGSKYNGPAYRLSLGEGTPLFTFIPSIGISNIAECSPILSNRYLPTRCLLVSSLIANSIYVVLIDPISNRVLSTERLNVGMRVRHIYVDKYQDNIYVSTDESGLFKLSIENVSEFFN